MKALLTIYIFMSIFLLVCGKPKWQKGNQFIFKEDVLKNHIKAFSKGKIEGNIEYYIKIIEDSIKLLEQLPNIRICKVDNINNTAIIFGDLHGNFRDFNYLINKYGIPGKHNQFVFNGDYVDRGEQQFEVLITILYSFILYPQRVFFNRGNHEDYFLNQEKQYMPNFQQDLKRKFSVNSSKLFNHFKVLFSYITLATVVENNFNMSLFIVHGGISNDTSIDSISKINRKDFKTILNSTEGETQANQLADLLWSDPTCLKGLENNRVRNIGKYFGHDVSSKFLDNHGFTYLIRSHEVRLNGFSQDQDRCFTIFSASNYCNKQNKGAVIEFYYNSTNMNFFSYKTN